MLYYDFQNYEEFKEIFGIVEHGNGVKSRKNKILLAAYKDKALFKRHLMYNSYDTYLCLYYGFRDRFCRIDSHDNTLKNKHRDRVRYIARFYRDKVEEYYINVKYDLLRTTNVADARNMVYSLLSDSRLACDDAVYRMQLMRFSFPSAKFETDDMNGLCEDGTLNAIRYRNIEKDHVFKMKAGKMFNYIMSCNRVVGRMPEQILRWMGEEFVAQWTEYARQQMSDETYVLHVDDNFHDIYDRDHCKGYDVDSDSFGSCMVNDGQWTFYRDSVKAKAAYLTDEDDMIVARCILFTEVKDQDGRMWRLAERQYSAGCDESLKRRLVNALIRGKHIDGYKRVGSSCHDGRDFVDNEGNSLGDKEFSIECTLDFGDTLSYQDSFKNLDMETHIATNYGVGDWELATTARYLESENDDDDNHDDEVWSDYNDEYIPSDDAYYVETRDDHFYTYQVVEGYIWSDYHNRFICDNYMFEGDCVEIDGTYYYAGTDCEERTRYHIYECPECGSDMAVGERGTDTYHSDLTDVDYCCVECMEAAERDWHEDQGHVYSEYDECWFEDDEDVITAMEKCGRSFYSVTISVDTFNSLVEQGKATEYNGDYYIDKVMYDGEPAHLGLVRKVA